MQILAMRRNFFTASENWSLLNAIIGLMGPNFIVLSKEGRRRLAMLKSLEVIETDLKSLL